MRNLLLHLPQVSHFERDTCGTCCTLRSADFVNVLGLVPALKTLLLHAADLHDRIPFNAQACWYLGPPTALLSVGTQLMARKSEKLWLMMTVSHRW